VSRRILVVGAGSIGQRHVLNLWGQLGFKPEEIAVSDLDMRKVEMLPGVTPVEAIGRTAEEVVVEDAKAHDVPLVICTTAMNHPPYIKAAIEHHVPFFVEKPAVLAERDLTDREWNTGVPHLVGYNWRWHRGYRRAEALARTAQVVDFACLTDMATWPGEAYGDVLAECSHDIDLALHWCGPLTRADAVRDGAAWHLRLEHDSGQVSRLTIDPSATAPSRGVRIGGEDFPGDLGRLLATSYVDEMDHFLQVYEGVKMRAEVAK
jgi:predicted dehydrogenase